MRETLLPIPKGVGASILTGSDRDALRIKMLRWARTRAPTNITTMILIQAAQFERNGTRWLRREQAVKRRGAARDRIGHNARFLRKDGAADRALAQALAELAAVRVLHSPAGLERLGLGLRDHVKRFPDDWAKAGQPERLIDVAQRLFATAIASVVKQRLRASIGSRSRRH